MLGAALCCASQQNRPLENSALGQNPRLPQRNTDGRFASDSGHHQHRGWEGFGCRGPVGLTRLALACFTRRRVPRKGAELPPPSSVKRPALGIECTVRSFGTLEALRSFSYLSCHSKVISVTFYDQRVPSWSELKLRVLGTQQ